jgi:AcrR family transcriptional regulator
MAKKKIHRGYVLRDVAHRSTFPIDEIARRAGYSRSSFYKHIEKEDLDYAILERYGKVLGYDFTKDFPKMGKYMFFEKDLLLKPVDYNEALESLEVLQRKHYELLEEHLKLQKKYEQLKSLLDQEG